MALTPVRVELDQSPVFEAQADLNHRWNGFLHPRFTLAEVRRLAAFTPERVRTEGIDWDSVHVLDMEVPRDRNGHESDQRSVVLMVGWDFATNGKPSEWTTVIDPDENGLYDIGGGGWAWSEVGLIPVEQLEPLAGRRVRFVGEFLDPYDVASGQAELPPWEQSFINYSTPKLPDQNDYFSISEEFDLDGHDAAHRIADLPVCLVMPNDAMEWGLSPTDVTVRGWEWSIAEAFTRLSMLPPVDGLHLPSQMDLPRSAELVQYLAAAYREAIRRDIADYPQRYVKTLERLAETEEALTQQG